MTHVACGGAHSLAVTAGGAVYGWGLNGQGQLGVGARMHGAGPYVRRPLVPTACIACAGDCIHRAAPTQIGSLTDDGVIASATACGFAHSCVLASDGSVFVFG